MHLSLPHVTQEKKIVLAVIVDLLLVAMLQDGRDGGVASPETRRLEGLKGGVGDGGEA